MQQPRNANHLRTFRKRSGLSQDEIAEIVGWRGGQALSSHEWGEYELSLRKALALEVLFREPLSRLFPEVHNAVERETESQIGKLERKLQQRSLQGYEAAVNAKKLVWLTQRKLSRPNQ